MLVARLQLGPPPDFGRRRWSVFEGRIRSCWGIRREGNTPELLERSPERRKTKKTTDLENKDLERDYDPTGFSAEARPPTFRRARLSWLLTGYHGIAGARKDAFWALRRGPLFPPPPALDP